MATAAANTERSQTCRDDDMAALPVELLHEIFCRVGSLNDLFLFAVTCRRWLRRFSDPAFLRGLCPCQGQGHRARLLGFLFRPTRLVHCDRMLKMRNAQRTSVSPPTFRPNPGSPLGATDRALTSFVADASGAFNYAQPLAARLGFVLMQLEPSTFNLHRILDDTVPFLVGICNPVTGERHVPPPPCFGRHVVYGYAIVTDSDLDGKRPSPTLSQLLLITGRSDGKEQLQLHSYTAAARSWRTTTLCRGSGSGSAAIHQGAAHWLYRGADDKLYKLSVELATARVSTAKLSVRAGGSPLLCVRRDGKLSVACVYPMHVTVWTEQDDGDPAAWLRTQVIQIPMAVPHPEDPMEWEEWYEFNRGTMAVMYRGGGVFVLDLEEEVMEKVMDCYPSLSTDNHRISYVPYEMDLVDFFVSRLVGLLCRG